MIFKFIFKEKKKHEDFIKNRQVKINESNLLSAHHSKINFDNTIKNEEVILIEIDQGVKKDKNLMTIDD